MSKEAQQTVRLYLVLTFGLHLGIALPISTFVVFFLERGLTQMGAHLVYATYFLVVALLEMPTGVIADVFGRKTSFVLSCLFFATAMTVYALASSLSFYLIAESIRAIGLTLASGAFTAWVVDRLKHFDYDTAKLRPVFIKMQYVSTAAAVSGATIGAYAASINNVLPWVISAVVMLTVAGSAIIFMKEEYFQRKKLSLVQSLSVAVETFRQSVRISVRHSAVRSLIVIVATYKFAVQAPDFLWQPFFLERLPSKAYLGLMFSSMTLLVLIGATLSPWIVRKLGDERKTLLTVMPLAGLSIVLSALFPWSPAVFAVFLMHALFRGPVAPIAIAYLHERIPSEQRATIASFESTVTHISGAFGLVISGLLVTFASIEASWLMAGLVLASLGVVSRLKLPLVAKPVTTL